MQYIQYNINTIYIAIYYQKNGAFYRKTYNFYKNCIIFKNIY